MMGWIHHHQFCVIVVIFLTLLGSISASTLIPDCRVNFEFQNFTIITSQCKGPQYPPKLCCTAFKEFACPFVDDLNDLTNECATTMFSYINLFGNYPPGLFASECREGKEGLECPAPPPPPPSQSADVNGSLIRRKPCSAISTFLGIILLVFLLVNVGKVRRGLDALHHHHHHHNLLMAMAVCNAQTIYRAHSCNNFSSIFAAAFLYLIFIQVLYSLIFSKFLILREL